VLVALVISVIELASVLAQHLSAQGAFWQWIETIDINIFGFIIAGLFFATWLTAVTVWRFGHIEERWTTAVRTPSGD
jgi:high-affinity nickel-transport protein